MTKSLERISRSGITISPTQSPIDSATDLVGEQVHDRGDLELAAMVAYAGN